MLDTLTYPTEEIAYAVILAAGEPGRRLVGPVNMPEVRHEFLVMALTESQEYAELVRTALERLYKDSCDLQTPTGLPLCFHIVKAVAEPPVPTRDNCP
jgi:hypothetical protein